MKTTQSHNSARKTVRVFLGRGLRALENLVWPVQCAGCGRWDQLLCDDCWKVIDKEPHHLVLDDSLGVPSWPLIALGDYEGTLRDIILTAKHDSRRDMSRFLFEAGRQLGTACAPEVARLFAFNFRRVWVVPAPSSRKRQRRRAEVVPDISAGMRDGLAEALATKVEGPVPVRVVNAVEMAGPSASMAGQTARSRGHNRAGSMRLVREAPAGTLSVVIDDVSTTGATLREVARLVGPTVLVCAVVAVAP